MSPEILRLIAWSTLDTLVMVGLSGLFGTLLGLPLGIFLATSRANELFPAPAANRILGLIVNATRSTPFIILVVAIVPLTRLVAGTSIGTRAAVVPLTIAAIPFIARVIEGAIREVDQGLVEAARAFGATDKTYGITVGNSADLVLLDAGEPDGYVRNWTAPGFPPMRHIAYAVQWFGLALALIIIYIVTNVRRAAPGTQGNRNLKP